MRMARNVGMRKPSGAKAFSSEAGAHPRVENASDKNSVCLR